MGTSRFVRPDTCILTISNGDTLTVKRRLNAVDSRMMRAMEELPTLAQAGVVMAYLVDWTLVGHDGTTKEPILGASRQALGDALDNLSEDDFDEIYSAVVAHRAAMKVEREQEKNGLEVEKNASAISPSPSGSAGAWTGSETLT